MSFSHWAAVAALAALPHAATAQRQPPHPADANAAVPASDYVSAFRNYRAATGESVFPDKAWRAANEEVQSQDGHAGHARDSGTDKAASETVSRGGHDGHDGKGK